LETLLEPRSREWLLAFEGYLARQGRAAGTLLKYGHALSQFEAYLDGRLPGELASEDLDRYLDSWRLQFVRTHGRWPSTATYRAQVCALRAFFKWLEQFDLLRDAEGLPTSNPMRRISAPAAEQKANDWLRPSEDRALLSVECSAQEQIVVWLLRWTGLRVGEATGLLVSDVDLTPGEECLVVRASKTPAGRRTIPMVPELLPRIDAWMYHLETAGLLRPDAPLLATRQGSAVKASYVWRLVKRVAYRAEVRPVPCTCGIGDSSSHFRGCRRTRSGENLSEVSPHTLRRTFGSYLLNRGLRLEVVSKLLGHASTTVTERAYAEMLYETARREVLRALGHLPPDVSYTATGGS
jgi:integrase/recombinase XerD